MEELKKINTLEIPIFTLWDKGYEQIACHEWGDDYDIVYRYAFRNNIYFIIWHEEEEYGNDTHGWQARVETEDDVYRVAYKELTAENAWRKLCNWIDDL